MKAAVGLILGDELPLSPSKEALAAKDCGNTLLLADGQALIVATATPLPVAPAAALLTLAPALSLNEAVALVLWAASLAEKLAL